MTADEPHDHPAPPPRLEPAVHYGRPMFNADGTVDRSWVRAFVDAVLGPAGRDDEPAREAES